MPLRSTGSPSRCDPARALAVVGPSGAGKSTLADAILGVVQPSTGSVRIGGLSPGQFVRRYPGLVAYVPQSVALVSGSVRDNVALGLTQDEIDDDRVWAALKRAHLADYLAGAREGLDTEVGERGVQLSGGERQRLGIARALYTDPRLLVMDEATSALDAETENLVTQTIEELASDVTTITIAHRLATVRRADTVIYLDRGRLLAQGTFDEVRTAVPRFDHQANLAGVVSRPVARSGPERASRGSSGRGSPEAACSFDGATAVAAVGPGQAGRFEVAWLPTSGATAPPPSWEFAGPAGQCSSGSISRRPRNHRHTETGIAALTRGRSFKPTDVRPCLMCHRGRMLKSTNIAHTSYVGRFDR